MVFKMNFIQRNWDQRICLWIISQHVLAIPTQIVNFMQDSKIYFINYFSSDINRMRLIYSKRIIHSIDFLIKSILLWMISSLKTCFKYLYLEKWNIKSISLDTVPCMFHCQLHWRWEFVIVIEEWLTIESIVSFILFICWIYWIYSIE